MRRPLATYRLQLNHLFPLREATKWISYWHSLGISDLYASPLTSAQPGSLHGYDVINPNKINPEIGSKADLNSFSKTLHQHQMGLLFDFVPNHMSTASENAWWQDVLRKGRKSKFYRYFDLNWRLNPKFPYRRFFDINELVSLRVEDPAVFDAIHHLVFSLIRSDIITGLRIDHIDGLFAPKDYLLKLQTQISKIIGEKFYIVVEKILAYNETIPLNWPVCGTTGYDFLNRVNTVFVHKKGYEELKLAYQAITGKKQSWELTRYQNKKAVIRQIFNDETKKLALDLQEVMLILAKTKLDLSVLEEAIIEVTANLGVYRTYIENPPNISAKQKTAWINWVMHWQQYTGPVMAKGYEDTTSYIYLPLLSLAEVGSDVVMEKTLGNVHCLHDFFIKRQLHWPYSLNASSTHDTKRSEDVRARINVLSEIPQEWVSRVRIWKQILDPLKKIINGEPVPDNNLEFFIYQSLLGVWPTSSKYSKSRLCQRMKNMIVKAAREAKIYTSWQCPTQDYESALVYFIDILFREYKFMNIFLPFQAKIAFHGILNSLSQLVAKITAPGIPDFYQGTELWNFLLVDPDNRQVVDFRNYQKCLLGIWGGKQQSTGKLLDRICKNWRNGRIKMYVMLKALIFRQQFFKVFQEGAYIPLKVSGKCHNCVFAYARFLANTWIIVVIVRFTTFLVDSGQFPHGQEIWGKTSIVLPKNAPTCFRNIFTEEVLTAFPGRDCNKILLSTIFNQFPVAILTGTTV